MGYTFLVHVRGPPWFTAPWCKGLFFLRASHLRVPPSIPSQVVVHVSCTRAEQSRIHSLHLPQTRVPLTISTLRTLQRFRAIFLESAKCTIIHYTHAFVGVGSSENRSK